MKPITENSIEQSTIEQLQSLDWEYANGKDLSPDGQFCERDNFEQIILGERIRTALAKINPHLPGDAPESELQAWWNLTDRNQKLSLVM